MIPAPTVLIGFGMIGAGFASDRTMSTHFDYASHAQVLRDHPAFNWKGVVDPAPQARAAAETWGVPLVVAHINDLPDEFKPEVAVIATGPDNRGEALACLDSLRLAIMEKPLGTDSNAAADLLADCSSRQVAVQVNLFRRAEAVTRALAAGELTQRIGIPQAIFGVYGNGLRNNAVHMVDLTRMLAGDITSVRALGPARPMDNPPIIGDVQLPFTLTLSSGICATLQPIDFTYYREVGLDIWGTSGRLEILQEGLLMRTSPIAPHRALDNGREIANDTASNIDDEYGHALYSLYDNAAAWLSGAEQLVSPGKNALINERVLDAVLQSAAQGGNKITVRP